MQRNLLLFGLLGLWADRRPSGRLCRWRGSLGPQAEIEARRRSAPKRATLPSGAIPRPWGWGTGRFPGEGSVLGINTLNSDIAPGAAGLQRFDTCRWWISRSPYSICVDLESPVHSDRKSVVE